MFPADPPDKDQKSDDRRAEMQPGLDHFYQLILMDDRAKKAWEDAKAEAAAIEQQKRLAEERKKLLQKKTSGKKSKK